MEGIVFAVVMVGIVIVVARAFLSDSIGGSSRADGGSGWVAGGSDGGGTDGHHGGHGGHGHDGGGGGGDGGSGGGGGGGGSD